MINMTGQDFSSKNNDSQTPNNPLKIGVVIEGFLIIILLITAGLVAVKNAEKIKTFFFSQWFSDFSTMQVSDGFHEITIPNGNHWSITYETDHEVIFEGQVKVNYPIREKGFEILTQDILVTSGDYSNPELVRTDVSNHRFMYKIITDQRVFGKINLLHTFPMNEEINQQLQQLKPGDNVIIKGWEILSLTGWDKNGRLLRTWQDTGCNTTLITEVVVVTNQ